VEPEDGAATQVYPSLFLHPPVFIIRILELEERPC
jgi:hypothetical protein